MDRTTAAVVRQLRAMGCREVEAGIRDGVTGRMILKTWSVDELVKAISWLKSRNVAGCDIYIRPDGPTALVLLDDLTLGMDKELVPAGLAPCCVSQTSPGNFQAWVRLSDQPIHPSLGTAAAKLLANRFRGDPNSASHWHFGRLCGFTNRKPNRRDAHGRAPFVLLEEATGATVTNGAAVLQEAERQIEAARMPSAPRKQSAPINGLPDPVRTFLECVDGLRQAYGAAFNASIADWKVAARMKGLEYTREQVELALRHSPNLEQRKRGHLEKYLRTTMDKLWPEGGGS